MSSNTVYEGSNKAAFQTSFERMRKEYPGEKLTPAKAKVVSEIFRALDSLVQQGIIPKEDARKAAEIGLVVGHRESDLNPEAKNPQSNATGVFQQMPNFPQRSRVDPQSVRMTPLTVEQRKDVFTSAGAFFRQLASTPNWENMRLVDASYQVQKYRKEDQHRYNVPHVHRIANCLSSSAYPDSESILDNGQYSPDEVAERRCDNSGSGACGTTGCFSEHTSSDSSQDGSTPTSPSNEARPRIHIPLEPEGIEIPPNEPFHPQAREAWCHAMQSGTLLRNPITALMGISGGAALGAATGGGVTLIPSATGGLLVSMNLLHPAGQVGALIGCGVIGTCCLYDYFTADGSDSSA